MSDQETDSSPAALKTRAATIIARGLTSGDLRHPNNPQGALFIPGMQPNGHRNPDVADAISATAVMIGEALIDTVLSELGAQLVTSADLETITTVAANTPSRTVTLHCDHGELLTIVVKPGTDTAHIACRRLRANLTECETH